MKKKMVKIPKEDLDELVIVARNLREAVERLATERNELKKDLTLTKAQLEEAWEQIK